MCFPPVCFFPLFFCGFHHPFLNATQLKPYLPPRVSDPLAAPWLLGRPHHWCCLHGRWHLLLTNFTSRLLRPWAWMQLHCPVALFITCWLAVSPRFSWGGCCFLRRLLASKYLGPLPPTKQKWKEVGRSAAKEIWKHTAHCKCGLSSAKKCFWSLKSFFFPFFSFYWEWNKNRPTKRDSRELVNVGKIYKAMEVWPEAECLAGKLAASFSWLAASLPCFIFFSFPSIFLSEPMLTCCFLSPGPFFLLERPAPGRPSGFLFSRLVCSQVSGRGTQAGEDLPPHEWGGPEWKVGGKRGVRLPPEQGETALAHCSKPWLPIGITWEP